MESESQWTLLGHCKFCRCSIYAMGEERRYEGPPDCNCEVERDISELRCPKCGWDGHEYEAENPRDDDYTEYLCPRCRCELEEQDDDT